MCKVREHGETCEEIERWKDFSEESRTFWLPEAMVTRLFRWLYGIKSNTVLKNFPVSPPLSPHFEDLFAKKKMRKWGIPSQMGFKMDQKGLRRVRGTKSAENSHFSSIYRKT